MGNRYSPESDDSFRKWTWEDVAYNNPHIEVCEEYDVLYPESIENIQAGDVLDFNTVIWK